LKDKDKWMMDILMQDKSNQYKVIIDNDCVSVDDIEKEENIYNFEHFGYEFILELFQYLNISAEMC